MQQQRFDQFALGIALQNAAMSNDPSTMVGAVITRGGEIISTGWNRFPRGIEELPGRMADRETKLSLIIHAEQNAIISGGHRVEGGTMYVAAMDNSGEVWGGPPCTRCLVHVIEAGIRELVSFPIKTAPSRWHADLMKSLEYAQEAGIFYREVSAQAFRGIGSAGRRPDASGGVSGRSLHNHPGGCK